MRRAAFQAGVQLTRDPKTITLTRRSKPGEWEIWVTDAELLAALVRQTTDAGVSRVALWRISDRKIQRSGARSLDRGRLVRCGRSLVG